ncbi:MAG: hypothetical protein AAF772_15915 [Acidobacteriota bacterium]
MQPFPRVAARRVGLLIAAAATLLPLAATAQNNCADVKVRTWHPNGEVVWTELNEAVSVPAGREAHIYLHMRARGPEPYSTQATIGYPQAFGAGGREQDVAKHVRMEKQNDDDRRAGRIRFRTAAAGRTQLGYQITGVKSPGDLNQLAQRCRTGFIDIVVREAKNRDGRGDGGSAAPPKGGPQTDDPATQLVADLYQALLRRDAGEVDPGFVSTVRSKTVDGLIEVATAITRSDEFRTQALRRAADKHGSSLDGEQLRARLLRDIYDDLYGSGAPAPRAYEQDLDALTVCLAERRDADSACAELGRNLVRSPLYTEHQRDLIEQMMRRR